MIDKKDIKVGMHFWAPYRKTVSDYIVGWIGERSVIVKDYMYMRPDAMEVSFSKMHKTEEEARKSIKKGKA